MNTIRIQTKHCKALYDEWLSIFLGQVVALPDSTWELKLDTLQLREDRTRPQLASLQKEVSHRQREDIRNNFEKPQVRLTSTHSHNLVLTLGVLASEKGVHDLSIGLDCEIPRTIRNPKALHRKIESIFRLSEDVPLNAHDPRSALRSFTISESLFKAFSNASGPRAPWHWSDLEKLDCTLESLRATTNILEPVHGNTSSHNLLFYRLLGQAQHESSFTGSRRKPHKKPLGWVSILEMSQCTTSLTLLATPKNSPAASFPA